MKQITSRWIAILVLAILAIYISWLVIQPFISVLLWAMTLAIVAHPICARLQRLGWSPNISAGITLVLVVMVVVLPLAFVVTSLVNEATDVAPSVTVWVHKLMDPESAWMKKLNEHPDLKVFLQTDDILARVREVAGEIGKTAMRATGNIILVLGQVFLILFALFFLLRDSQKILLAIRNFIPLDKSQVDQVFQSTRSIVNASLYGVVSIALLQGIMGGLAFWALGIPSPLMWMVIMCVAAMIPIVGCGLIWVPAALYFLAMGAWVKALLLTLWGVLVIAMIDNLLRPKLVGQKTRLHELIIFFSVLGGLQVFGPLGLVMGPLAVAMAIAMVNMFIQLGMAAEAEEAAK